MKHMLSPKGFSLATTAAAAAFVGCFAAGCPVAKAANDRQSSELVPGVSLYGDPKAPDISGLWLGTVIGVPGKPSMTNSGGSQDGRPPTYLAPWLPGRCPTRRLTRRLLTSEPRGRGRAGRSATSARDACRSGCR